jgi:hypothetical protein
MALENLIIKTAYPDETTSLARRELLSLRITGQSVGELLAILQALSASVLT